jgi:hypothetical protein
MGEVSSVNGKEEMREHNWLLRGLRKEKYWRDCLWLTKAFRIKGCERKSAWELSSTYERLMRDRKYFLFSSILLMAFIRFRQLVVVSRFHFPVPFPIITVPALRRVLCSWSKKFPLTFSVRIP